MADRPHALNRAGRTSIGLVVALLVLGVVELAWFHWYLSEPLPNAQGSGGRLTRSYLLWHALPEIVPGWRWSESYLKLALDELSHVENLPQRVPIVLAASWIIASAIALGALVLRALGMRDEPDWTERAPIAFGLGATGLGVVTLVAGRLGLLSPWGARFGLAVPILIAGAWRPSRPSRTNPERGRVGRPGLGTVGFVLIGGPFLVLMALAAMLPTIDFDALEYHLQGPKEHFLNGRITFQSHNVYTSMPFSVEMLHLLGMEVLDDWWRGALVGQLVVMVHAPMAAWLIAATARRVASPRAGWVAAVVYLTTPWVYRLAAIPYVEGPLCFDHAALLAAACSGVTGARRAGLLGLLAGGAMATKYPALVSAVVPFGALVLLQAVRGRSPRLVLAFAAGCAVTVGPWLAKNVVDTGNPVYPLAYGVFGGGPWSAEREVKWSNAHGPRPVTMGGFVNGVLDIAGRSDWQSALFTALAPLALLRVGSRRAVLWLWGYVAYLFATWFVLTHRIDRFWAPMLPALAVLAGVGADWVRSRLWTACLAAILTIGTASNLVYITTALAGLNQWTGNLDAMRKSVPQMLNPPLFQLDQMLPPGARPLLVGQASVFHLNHRVVFNTVFDDEILELIAKDKGPREVLDELHRRGITHIYVDWHEIERHRKPGGYGFTDFVTPELFDGLVREGALEPAVPLGPRHELYPVR